MDNPPDEIRPGLSSTAKITTATREQCPGYSHPGADRSHKGRSRYSNPKDSRSIPTPPRQSQQGRDHGRVRDGPQNKAEFQKVETGITGATDIEVSGGLKEGDEIVIGLTRSSALSKTKPA